eukprot:COSAG04_NODE_13255_length_613_cov_1.490272_1_plen_105_part_01
MSAAQCLAAGAEASQARASLTALRAEQERERARLEERQRAAMVALRAEQAAAKQALDGTNREAELQAEEECARLDVALRASLPFLGDDIFVLIAAELDARMLGRL